MSADLSEYFARKQQARIAKLTPDDFLPYEESKERDRVEKLEPMLVKFRESDHDWFKTFSRRRGTSMHSSELIYRLQQLNSHIFVQQQINFATDWGVYREIGGHIQYLSAVPKGWLTEMSYSLVDDRDLPLEERRGWRTVAVMCLLKGALTWEQVLAEFGDPEDHFNDARWQAVTKDFRYGGEQVALRNMANAADRL